MSISDLKYTVLQVVNEVQRRLSLTQTANLTANTFARKCLDFVNDTVNDISDFGNWMETLATAKVTAVSGQRDYQIQTSAVVKNVGDVYIDSRRGPLRFIDTQDMRILTRTTSIGQPSQCSIFGVDSNGNPNIRMRPTPGANEAGSLFSILYYIKPPLYTTSDSSTIIPFPAKVVVLGTLARACLDESAGSPTNQYEQYWNDYLSMRKESLNRYNSDTGYDVQYAPGRVSRWRR